jgi:hypothetical protein
MRLLPLGRASFRELHAESEGNAVMLEHDPEKWIPVFPRQTRSVGAEIMLQQED